MISLPLVAGAINLAAFSDRCRPGSGPEVLDHLAASARVLAGRRQETNPNELASPTWEPGDTGSGDRPEHCLLLLAAIDSLAGAPSAPYLVAEPFWHAVPVAAAHQAGLIYLDTTARYRAEACRSR
jgi:hypothetical protein